MSTILLISWTTKIPNLNSQFNVKKILWGPIQSKNTFTVTSHTKRRFCVSKGFTVWPTKNRFVPSDVCRTKLTPNIARIHKIKTLVVIWYLMQFSSNVQNVLGVHATCTNIPKLESPLYNLWSPSMQRVTLAVFGSLSSQLSCDLQVRVYIHLILCSLANPRLWAVLESESLEKARLDLV